ncbi:MAG: ATP-dependent Clp protease adaptor ClpS [Candidatus Lambdaproteobacteria bacterium]|nr:ATP-dependent Clp protease adaptor ClpS [Candidatus Lambdaproteobacteria bacterium]
MPGLDSRHAWHRPKGAGEPQDDKQLLAVRVMDNPLNTVREVIDACSRALPVSEREAFRSACTIDHAGSCVVCVEPRAEAERVAAIIQRIGIEVRLEPYAPET